jgi:vacuolar protein sorting-associated protein 51
MHPDLLCLVILPYMSRSSSPSPHPSIPRPPSSSQFLNPTAEASNQRPVTRRASVPTTPPSNKTRARDLLRKHYGLGLGPPPPLTGESKAEDPMDLGEFDYLPLKADKQIVLVRLARI